jgi:pentatricopeptide repeat protein
MGKHQLAIICFNKSIELSKTLGDEEYLSNSYNSLGVAFAKLGNYTEAINNYLLASKIYGKQRNTLYIASTYINIGLLYKQQEQYDKALENYFKTLAIVKNEKNNDGDYYRAFTYSNIGQTYLKQGKEGQALATLNAAMEIGKKFNDSYFNADTYRAIADCYSMKGDYDKAMKIYQKALILNKNDKQLVGVSECYINIGLVYLKEKEYSRAIENTNKGLAIAKEIGQLEFIKNAYRNLADIYKELNDFKLAYKNQVLFKQVNDSMFNTEKDKKITALQLTYEFNKKQEATKRQQQKKDAVLEAKAEKQKRTTYSVMLILFFVTLFAIWIYLNLKKNQKQKKIIEKQNGLIQSALSEKEILMREIYHRVKNNLQFVSAVIQMQISSSKSKNDKSVLNDTSRRINAMTLVHEMLYNKDKLESVSLQKYLTELVEKLNEIVNESHLPIHFVIEIEDLVFNINDCMAIGMISSELLSNAIKYAFIGIDKPEITINLYFDPNSKNIIYKVKDNGTGFGSNTSSGLGLRLIDIFTRQLKGTFSRQNDNGSSYTFEFPHHNK